MQTPLTTAQRDSICNAYAQASCAVPDIVGELHTLHHCGRDMRPERRTQIMADALTAAQTLLVAIVAADRAMKAEPAERERVPA